MLKDNPNWMWCRFAENYININVKCHNDRREKGDKVCPFKDCWKKEERNGRKSSLTYNKTSSS